ncbi:hypothetical protein KY290_007171 [Solanum tuberosum]|uniref:Integrase core domain containing protein n=1 Tax=Solanum tuberosum TaxID=4113 RepID=A0ABQ7W590_SOLTU|nr:hypothetical protein KY290_007171 [Solanum tuberosum]
MADTTTTTISGDSIPIPDDQQNNPTNPLASFISSVLQFFKPPPPSSKKIEPTAATSDLKPIASAEKEEKAAVVKFPRQDLPSLKLETEGAEPNTNPIVLWQTHTVARPHLWDYTGPPSPDLISGITLGMLLLKFRTSHHPLTPPVGLHWNIIQKQVVKMTA